MSTVPIESLFERFRRSGDLVALTQVFDEVAPELLPLALRLAGARHDAEDLVQETFLVALEKSADYDAARPLRPWLVGILVREARRLRRSSARVIEPERVVATPPPEPPEQAEESEWRAAVEQALGELPPKYSEVVSLHLFEGLAPREMSARLGIDAELVRTHLSRGLERLRRSLPASTGAAWSTADLGVLLPRIRGQVLARAKSLPIQVGAASGGVFGLAVGLAAGLVVVAALTAGVLLLVRGSASTATAREPIAAEAGVASTQPVGDESVLEVAPSTTRVSVAEPQSKFAPGLTLVRGRLLMPDGSGARGVPVALEGWPSNEELVLKYGVPKDWKNPPDVQTDETGEFRFAVDPPRAFQWIARAKQTGFVDLGWRWSEWMRGTEKQLGKATFQPGCTVTGTLVRADGQPIGPGWSISATPSSFSQVPEVLDIFGNGQVDRRDGSFRVEGLAAGATKIAATHEVGLHGCESMVMLTPAMPTSVKLTWVGSDPSHTVCVRVTDALHAVVSMEGARARLIDSNGVELLPKEPLAGSLQMLSFESVPDADWRLELEVPGFAKVSREAVHPGQVVRIALVGNAGIQMSVTDADGKPVDHYDALLALKLRGSSRLSRLASIDEASPAARSLPGLPSLLPFRIEVSALGFGTAHADCEGLAAGEVRPVRITLERAREIEVLALDSDGQTPLAGVEVELTRGRVGGHTLGEDRHVHTGAGEIPPREFVTNTGSDGRARFTGLAVDTWTVRANWSPWFWSDAQVDLRPAQVGTCKVAMPEHGYMRGKLLLAEGAPRSEPLVVVNVEHDLRGDPFGNPLPWSAIGQDGNFRLGPFAPGRVVFLLMRSTNEGYGSRKPVEVARVQIESGKDIAADIDLRHQCTAHLDLKVRLGGKVLPSPEVTVILVDPPGQGVSDSAHGAEGSVRVPLAPEARQLIVLQESGAWLYRLPEVFKPGECESIERSVDIPLAKGSLLVLDAQSREPLRNTLVSWSMEARQLSADPAVVGSVVMSTDASGTTDSEGKLDLTLPPGDLRFELRARGAQRQFSRDPKHWGEPEGPCALLRWTERGPTEATIALPRP